MTSLPVEVHKDFPKAYWRLEEAAGATSVKDSGITQQHDGTPVGAVTFGVPGLVQVPSGKAASFKGGHITVPADSPGLGIPQGTIGAIFQHDKGLGSGPPEIWLKLDEQSGTVADDASPNGHDGTYSGMVLDQLPLAPGSLRSVKSLPYQGDITVPHDVDLNLNDGAFTIMLWVQRQSFANTFPGLFRKGAPGAHLTADGYLLYYGNLGTYTFARNNNHAQFTVPTGTFHNQSHHVAIVYNGTTIQFYYDGQPIAGVNTTVTFPPNNDASNPLIVGRGDDYGDHRVDEFLIYRNALSASEILDAYAGSPPNTNGATFYGGIGKDSTYRLFWQSFSKGWTFDVWTAGVRRICENNNFPVVRGQRYFVVGTYDGATMRLYVNGAQVATASIAGTIDSTATAFEIGRPTASAVPWDGTIDEVFILDTSLSPARVAEYNSAYLTPGSDITCLPAPTPSRERIIYIRPDAAGTRKYLLHAPPSRVVLSEEGFGTPPLEYVTDRAPFQHGDSVRSFHLNPRQVQLVVLQNFRNRAEYWNGRQELLGMLTPIALQPGSAVDNLPALSPTHQGKLLYYLGNGKKRQLDVLLDSGPGFAPPQGGWREWSFTEVLRFTAHDPTWYDPLNVQVGLTEGAPSQLVFPVTFPVTFSTSARSGTVTYLGDWPSRPLMIAFGSITAPSFTNLTTGKKVGITATIPSGYAVLFDPANGKVVRSDGLNLLGFLTDDSDLTEFTLEPDPIAPGGVNEIVLDGTAFNPFAGPPLVSYYNRFMGI